jgi:hypothetical protein
MPQPLRNRVTAALRRCESVVLSSPEFAPLLDYLLGGIAIEVSPVRFSVRPVPEVKFAHPASVFFALVDRSFSVLTPIALRHVSPREWENYALGHLIGGVSCWPLGLTDVVQKLSQSVTWGAVCRFANRAMRA